MRGVLSRPVSGAIKVTPCNSQCFVPAAEADANKRDFDYRDDYDLTSLTMEPMTPFGDPDCLSDTQSDSELSSSSNSEYDLHHQLRRCYASCAPEQRSMLGPPQVACLAFQECAHQSRAAVNPTPSFPFQVSFKRDTFSSCGAFCIPLCQQCRMGLVNDWPLC